MTPAARAAAPTGSPAGRVALHVELPGSGAAWLRTVVRRHRDALLEAGLLPPADVREAPGAQVWQQQCDRARAWLRERTADGLGGTALLGHDALSAASPQEVARVLAPLAGLEVHVVVTACDLGRLVAAHWHEQVVRGDRRPFAAWAAEAVQGTWQPGLPRSRFWQQADPVETLARWTAPLPAGRGHLVVAPAPGEAPGVLWRRFTEALAVDPTAAPSLPAPTPPLGTLELALVREVHEAVADRLPPAERRRVVERGWAGGTLARSDRDAASAPVRTPAAMLPLLVEVTGAWVRAVDRAGHRVHGDLTDLAPVVAGAGDPHPDDVPRGALAARGARGIAERLVLEGRGPAPATPRPSLTDRVRRRPLVSVVVPAHGTEAWLPACLESALASDHRRLEVVVVDDGSPDRCGEIAERYAERDGRVRVVHVDNGGLGAARNVGVAHAAGDYLAFLDSDDVVPPGAWAAMLASLERTGSDFVTGSVLRWEADGLHEPPWMRRLHSPARQGIRAGDHPEVLGDVFAWNKLFRRSWWDTEGLCWPERLRYEDQPTTTEAYLRGRFDVLPQVVYHWRIRDDGSSITQQRSSLADLEDRLVTKQMTWRSVHRLGDAATQEVVLVRVLPGDLHRYFAELPGASDAWWELLVRMVHGLWGERSLVHSGLRPADRLVGWLVEQGRRADAVAVVRHLARRTGPLPRRTDPTSGALLLDVPAEVLDAATVAPAARGLSRSGPGRPARPCARTR